MTARFITIRVADRLNAPEADKAVFMESLCAGLVTAAQQCGSTGGVLEDVVWLPAEEGLNEGALVALRDAEGEGFDGINAVSCRDFLKRAAFAARKQELASGPLFGRDGAAA